MNFSGNRDSLIPEGYVPLPSTTQPWYLLPADDAGPFDYFANNLLSSRYPRRRWLVRVLRIITRAGGYRLWPVVASVLASRPGHGEEGC